MFLFVSFEPKFTWPFPDVAFFLMAGMSCGGCCRGYINMFELDSELRVNRITNIPIVNIAKKVLEAQSISNS